MRLTTTDSEPTYRPRPGATGNLILDVLPENEAAALIDKLSLVSIDFHEQIFDAGETFRSVDFPVDAGYSSVATFGDGNTCEVGLVGREGFSPHEIVLGVRAARRPVWCQIPGRVLRLSSSDFLDHLGRFDGLRELSRNYVIARGFIGEQLAACNALHTLYKRCARWLLMSRDRVGRDSFSLTHEYLATMLGVRRAGVTEVAGELQALGAIIYSRGKVTILDSAKLLNASCVCYGEVFEASQRALGLADPEGDGRRVTALD